ncbi:MAG: hypothetical protein C5B48_12040 [Candidatus Rokuibacteriota bacterium]|nr:MAG: hypothetical protein C5B48_12040 [Candidatus Rokubacteria bacterium]
MDPRRVVRSVRMLHRLVTAEPSPNEQAVVEAMADRVTEVVDDDGSVSTDGKVIHITGRNRLYGNSVTFAPFTILRALPGEEGVLAACESLGTTLRRFLGDCGEPWPSADAAPHVLLTDETINVWWGGPTEADASARLRPFSRQELGL